MEPLEKQLTRASCKAKYLPSIFICVVIAFANSTVIHGRHTNSGDVVGLHQQVENKIPKCTKDATPLNFSETPKPLTGKLKSDEINCYQVRLEKNQYMHIVVMQQDVDVQLELFRVFEGGSGVRYERVWKAIDSPNEYNGPEPVSEIAPQSSVYLLAVEHSPGTTSPGENYTITFEELRTATEKDERYVRAERNYLEGWSQSNSASFATDQNQASQILTGAIKLLKEALPLLVDTDRPKLKLKVLFRLAEAEHKLGALQDAAVYFRQESDLAKTLTDKNDAATALYNVAIVYNELHNVQESRKALEEAITLNGGLPADTRIQMLVNLGSVYRYIGEISKAVDVYNQVLVLIPQLNDPERQGYLFTIAGMFFFNVGELLKARDLYGHALELEGTKYLQQRSYALHQLGVVYMELGQSQKALDTFTELQRLRNSTPYKLTEGPPEEEDMAEVYLLANMGSAYASLGETALALDYYQKELDRSNSRFKDADAFTHLYRGNAYFDLNNEQAALDEYKIAGDLWANDKRGTANVLANVAKIIANKGEKQRALKDYLIPAIELEEQAGDAFGKSSSMTSAGAIELDLGQTADASRILNDALKLRTDIGDKKGEIVTRYQLARLERALGRMDAAREQIRAARDSIELLRRSISDRDLRATYFAGFQQVYALEVGLLVDAYTKHPVPEAAEAALSAAESARARSLLDTLAETRLEIQNSVNSDLTQREQRAQDKIAEVLARQARLFRNSPITDPGVQQQKKRIEGEFNAAIEELRNIRSEIRQESKQNKTDAVLSQSASLSGKEIKAMLDDDTLLLEFSLGDELSYLFIVSSKDIIPVLLPKRRVIEDLAVDAYQKLSARNKLPASLGYDERIRREHELDASFAQVAGKLSQVLFEKTAGVLGTKRLLIVKDGALQYIPFSALFEPNAKGGVTADPLLLKHEVVVLPSATSVASLREQVRDRARKTLMVLADPVYESIDTRAQETVKAGSRGAEPDLKFHRLAFSNEEKNQIAKLVDKNEMKSWEGFDVNMSNIISGELSNYRVVHFSMHGIFDFGNPNTSGLVLSLFNQQGKLEKRPILGINDIYNLHLSATLVVLSACETALGREIKGEGLVGLTRGFMYAGAPRVVASLWEVDDPVTAGFMKSFYSKILQDKLSTAEALRAAQKEVWEVHKKSPYYWAAFELQGDWK